MVPVTRVDGSPSHRFTAKALAKYLLSVTVWPGTPISTVSSMAGTMIQSTYPVSLSYSRSPEFAI